METAWPTRSARPSFGDDESMEDQGAKRFAREMKPHHGVIRPHQREKFKSLVSQSGLVERQNLISHAKRDADEREISGLAQGKKAFLDAGFQKLPYWVRLFNSMILGHQYEGIYSDLVSSCWAPDWSES